MNALITARLVLEWAVDPARPLPSGSLGHVRALAAPDQPTLAALADLAAITAARLNAGTPPFDDTSVCGLGALLIAAAVGGRLELALAEKLVAAVPRLQAASDNWAEAVLRHGMCQPLFDRGVAGTQLPSTLAEQILRLSPLTSVLHYPPAEVVAASRTAIPRLLARPHGRSVFVSAFCRPATDAAVLNWRSTQLEALRHNRPDIMLDVYGAARIRHAAQWDTRIAWAATQLRRDTLPDELPIATIRYWAPLARLDRDERGTASMGARITRAAEGRRQGSGVRIADRVFLRPADYAAATRLVIRYGLLPVEDLS